MIIIIEGCAGAGKSTLVYALAEKLRCPVYRGFRRSGGRTRAQDASQLAGLVSINTWREDIYAMDVLSQAPLAGGIILDRSLPSALAYDKELDGRQQSVLLAWWAGRLKGLGLIIEIIAEGAKAAARNKHGHSGDFIRSEAADIRHWCDEAQKAGVAVFPLENNRTIGEALGFAVAAVEFRRATR